MTRDFLIAFALSYLVGAIPFGVIATRSKGIDIFQFGSGNPGATNVARALGKGWGIAIFVLDVLKGVVPAALARLIIKDGAWGLHAQSLWFAVGLAAVLGHCCSVFLKFRGGKGIATSLGAGIGACPLVALSAFGIFVVVFLVTRFVSLASIVAVISAVAFVFLIPNQAPELALVFLALSIFVIYRHRANIRRLRNGTEPKFTLKKKKSDKKNEGDDASDKSSDPSTDERNGQ